MNKKFTIKLFFLSIIYGVFCFFCLGIAIRFIVTFVYSGGFLLERTEVVDTFVLSCIAGVAAGGGSWILAKIKEYKNSRSKNDPTTKS